MADLSIGVGFFERALRVFSKLDRWEARHGILDGGVGIPRYRYRHDEW
jgi:hypothetical protein